MLVIVVMPAAVRSVVMIVAVLVVMLVVMRSMVMAMLVFMAMMVPVIMAAAAPFAVLMIMMGMAMTMPMPLTMPLMMIVMIMVVGVTGLEISTTLGIECGFDRTDLAAKPRHHLLDHVIATDPQPPTRDLHRQVAVAQMPCELKEMVRALGADLGQRFWRADHLDEPSVLQFHRIARAQSDSLRQVEQECEAADALQRDPPPVAVVECQHDAVGRVAGPVALGDNFIGPDHRGFLNLFAARGARRCVVSPRRKQEKDPAGPSRSFLQQARAWVEEPA